MALAQVFRRPRKPPAETQTAANRVIASQAQQSADASLKIANNLSDVASVTTSRSNLGLGAVATLSLITTAYLATSSVTYPKMQQETAVTLLGNPNTASATVSEIPIGTGLAFSSGTLICTVTTAGTGTVTNIQTGTGLYGGPITSTGTIAITSSGITSGLIAAGAVVTASITAGAVVTASILAGSVVTASILNTAVTYAKIQDTSTTSVLLGRGTSSVGPPQEISLGPGLSMSGTTLSAPGSGGNVTGPGTVTASDIVTFSGTTGTAIQDSGKSFSTDGTFAANSDALSPTQKAVKTYVDAHVPAGAFAPGGRLTLTSGTPVMASDVTGSTTIYYALFNGNLVPIYDGSNYYPTAFTELSQTTTDTTKSPAACAAYKNYDMFVWSDSGTLRCTRGPAWVQAQTFTVSIATPAVVTAAAHGLKEGFPWVPTTTGSLPTGMTAGTPYFVISTGLTANTFQFSATVGGSAVNTSGTQSGTHTCTDSNLVRGTGAGTTELESVNGIYRNKVAITNGPGAGLGTYVGTVRTNGSSQIDYIRGGTGAAGGESTFLGVWNAYNRVRTKLLNIDSTANWNYTTAAFRIKDGNMANRIQIVCGLRVEAASAYNQVGTTNSSANVSRQTGVGVNATSAQDTHCVLGTDTQNVANGSLTLQSSYMDDLVAGYTQLCPLEYSGAAGTCTWYGGSQAGLFMAEVMA